jgi:voltage-gated potassium channel
MVNSMDYHRLLSKCVNFIHKYGLEISIRKRTYHFIFDSDTLAAKGFDLALIFVILVSVVSVILESIPAFNARFGAPLHQTEWIITIIFTLEYIARIWSHPKPLKYIFSFYGVIDFLAIIPTYLDLIFTGAMSLAVIRGLRLLRIFRILKITRYSREGIIIVEALKASRVKILVFLFAVVVIVLVIGTLMYLIERENSGFSSIPAGIYWAIVTLTTVGFGDVTPVTTFGKFIASFVMIMGYGIIAVPTGIVTFEIASSIRAVREKRVCGHCGHGSHDVDAKYCKSCGEKL